MINDYADAANRQHRHEAGRAQEIAERDLSEAAVPWCLYKLAHAAGEDGAADAAYEQFMEVTDSDEREHIEAQLACDFHGWSAWVACLKDEADRLERQKVKCKAADAVGVFIVAVMA